MRSQTQVSFNRSTDLLEVRAVTTPRHVRL